MIEADADRQRGQIARAELPGHHRIGELHADDGQVGADQRDGEHANGSDVRCEAAVSGDRHGLL